MNFMEKVKNINDDECIVDVLLNLVSKNECKDCGKCVFGYEGITQLEAILSDMTLKKGKNTDLQLISDLCQLMSTQAICETGTDMGKTVLFVLENYKNDMENHSNKKECRAGVCKGFLTYHILADKCIGCNECVDSCEEEAILGKKRFIHVIDQSECVQCGLCIDACDEGAIVRAGAIKPKCPKKPIPCKVRA